MDKNSINLLKKNLELADSLKNPKRNIAVQSWPLWIQSTHFSSPPLLYRNSTVNTNHNSFYCSIGIEINTTAHWNHKLWYCNQSRRRKTLNSNRLYSDKRVNFLSHPVRAGGDTWLKTFLKIGMFQVPFGKIFGKTQELWGNMLVSIPALFLWTNLIPWMNF